MFNKIREIKSGMDKIRTGRKQRNIAKEIAETIRQHSRKVARAVGIYGKHFPDIDLKKAVKMAKYHDVAEYKEKDYVPGEISKEEKHRREKIVILELKEYFGEEGEELYNLRMEYEEEISKEAQLVKQLDKLDAAIQAIEYEKGGYHNLLEYNGNEEIFKKKMEKLVTQESH